MTLAPPRVGVDIVRVARIRRVFGRGSEDRLRAVFAASEIADCRMRASPFESLAARFAAKESFVKAVSGAGRDTVGPRDVVVVLDEMGVPRLETRGSATRAMHAIGCSRAALSISHERAYAIAVVLLM